MLFIRKLIRTGLRKKVRSLVGLTVYCRKQMQIGGRIDFLNGKTTARLNFRVKERSSCSSLATITCFKLLC